MRKAIVFIMGLVITGSSFGQDVKWIIMGKTGSAYNFKTPLEITQDNYPDIKFNAKYSTKPFSRPPYYQLSLVRWKEDRGWGLKFTHHKLYLENNPPDIQSFTVTNGYNLITLAREWKIGWFIYHIGGGVVITHPESVVRGQKFSEKGGLFNAGYYFSGPVVEAAIEKRINLSKRFLLSFEGRLTGSYVKMRIANGNARTSNIAIHVLGGIGYSFGK